MDFNVITGLPRSGSTLLCNLFNQNPKFYAGSTSHLGKLFRDMMTSVSTSAEIKSDLAFDRRLTEIKILKSFKAVTETWYQNDSRKVFDKSRAWQRGHLALKQVYPESKMIVTIRDLREVAGSIEKQHRKYPLFDATGGVTLRDSLEHLFAKDVGLITRCLIGIQDLLDREADCLFVRLEDLLRNPEEMMKRIYCYLLEEPFDHNFIEVENTATDLDALYLFKFPHDGSGEVKDPGYAWRRWMSEEVGQMIFKNYNWFFKKFGYGYQSLGQIQN